MLSEFRLPQTGLCMHGRQASGSDYVGEVVIAAYADKDRIMLRFYGPGHFGDSASPEFDRHLEIPWRCLAWLLQLARFVQEESQARTVAEEKSCMRRQANSCWNTFARKATFVPPLLCEMSRAPKAKIWKKLELQPPQSQVTGLITNCGAQ